MRKTLLGLLLCTVFAVSANAQIVLPSVTYAPGFNGSFWKTAVAVYNPTSSPQTVSAQSITLEGNAPSAVLAPGQYFAVDNLAEMFGLGYGTFLVTVTSTSPEVVLTARTYSTTEGVDGQFSTSIPVLEPIVDTEFIVFTQGKTARKALFLYGNLHASCYTMYDYIPSEYDGTPGTLTRFNIANETVFCKVVDTNPGFPSGGDPSMFYFYAWGSEADNITNCPTLIPAD